MARVKPYVGKTILGTYRLIRSDVEPTEETHGDEYAIAYGPFETVGAAKEFAFYWNSTRISVKGERTAREIPLRAPFAEPPGPWDGA